MKSTNQQAPQIITNFNKCSLLPLIQAQVGNYTICAIIDSGASRSLVSTSMASKLWGSNYSLNMTPFQIPLRDVNNRQLKTMGTINAEISINGFSFTQNFIIYESACSELLLGFNFIKSNGIAIYPNLGLIFESQLQIYSIQEQLNLKCSLKMCQDVTIHGGDQQVVKVYLSEIPSMTNKQIYVNGTWLAHSENLEPDQDFENLTMLHQYISVTPNLDADILLINHTDAPVVFSKDTTVGHLEETEIIAHINELEQDPLLQAIYSCFSNADIQPPESRIFAEVEDFQFNELDINCASENPTHIEFLKNLHLKYKTIFNSNEFCPGRYGGSEVHFSLKSGATIPNQKFHRINPAILDEAQNIINHLLRRGLIEISNTPYSSRLLFVRKAAQEIQKRDVKDGQNFVPGEKIKSPQKRRLRLVFDMRHINERLKTSHLTWVTPSIWHILSDFQNVQYLSSIDLNSCFWTFPLSKKCSQYTGFDFLGIRYICTRMPQGLKISSTETMAKMKKFVLRHNLKGIKLYIDNIIILGVSLQDYKENLEAFFKACLAENFIIKMKKSHHFIHSSFNIFGYEINLQTHTIGPEKAKVTKILDIPTPTTKRKVKQFIGATSYFGNMIKDLQVKLGPLHAVASPKTRFFWNNDCQNAFSDIKKCLSRLPFIFIYNTSLPVHAFCDGAQFSHIAYSLFQFSKKYDKFVPIKYNSHKLTNAEMHLSQIEVEALALMFVLSKEESVLAFNNGVLHTDARSLTYIMHFSNITSKIARWNLILRSFDISVIFTPNKDALISFVDLMTRGNVKAKFKNKITQEDLADFLQINYEGMPQLSMAEALDVIQKSVNMLRPMQKSSKYLNNAKTIMPAAPPINLVLGPDSVAHFRPGELIGAVVQSIDFSEEQKSGGHIPTLPPLSGKSLKITDENLVTKNNLKENMSLFLPELSLAMLAKLQRDDPTFSKIFENLHEKKSHQQFFLHESILFKKHRLQNNILVDLIAIPKDLASQIIKRFHNQNFFQHLGLLGMKRHLQTIFFIKNFTNLATKVIQDCVFCTYNKSYPNRKLEPGLKLHVDAPKKFIAMDICTIRSKSPVDSFLTIVDIFSRYSVFIPINADCTASVILDCLVQNWIRFFGFPASILVDGAKNFTNSLIGSVAANLNIKLCRISPYNSQSNLAERYNRFALLGVKIFHQSYGINDNNFGIILSMIGQMLNSQKLPNGFTPAYLMTGSESNFSVITFQTVGPESKLDQHCKNILRAQNICYALQQKSLENIKSPNNPSYDKFQPGSFVLLKKKGTQPRHMIKSNTLYHSTPFRILRRTTTNAVIVPFGLGYLKQRFKHEGQVPKNLCTLQRLSNLKPIKNPFKLLRLTFSQKMLLELNSLLQSDIQPIPIVEIISNKSTDKPAQLFHDFNASVKFIPNENEQIRTKQPLQIEFPSPDHEIEDIRKVKLHSLNRSFKDSELYVQSTIPSIKLVKKKKVQENISDCSSTVRSAKSNFSFQIEENYFDDDLFDNSSRQESPSNSSHSGKNSIISVEDPASSDEIFTSFQDAGIRIFGQDDEDQISSSRPPHSSRKTIKTITRINLSSGRCLDFSFAGDESPAIQDLPDTPASTKPRLSARLEQPISMISNLSKRTRTSTKSKGRKSNT